MRTRGSHAADRPFGDQFIPWAMSMFSVPPMDRLPGVVVRKASEHLDLSRATDLTRTWTDGHRVEHWALRAREHHYARSYGFDVTLRSRRDSGAETELSKILDGFGDRMLYGFQSAVAPMVLGRWVVLDLHALRRAVRDEPAWWRRTLRRETDNRDGTHFVPLDTRELKRLSRIVIRTSPYYWQGEFKP